MQLLFRLATLFAYITLAGCASYPPEGTGD